MSAVKIFVSLLVAILAFARCEYCDISGTVPNPSPAPDAQSPDSYTVSFKTNAVLDGKEAPPIVMQVTRAWAPLGSDRFYSLVKDGFYNQAAFFRLVPDFVVQFGISADPKETSKWNTIIPDDPVLMSNTNWTVSYATAGPDTRTSQIFINYVDNSRLDASGFAPFAKVVSGFETALALVNPTPGNSNGVNQEMYEHKGNDWILQKYPDISLIACTYVQEP
jgi:cyclophilin family peptidyl-prolyl cis-trans isomerase